VDAIEPLGRSGGSEALASRLFPWHPNPHSFHDETGEAHDSRKAAKLKARQIARSLAHEPASYGGTKWLAVDKSE